MKISLLKSPLAIMRLLKEVNKTGFVNLDVVGQVRLRYGQDGSDPALGTTRPEDFIYLTCNFTQVVRACADNTTATPTLHGAKKCVARNWSKAVRWPHPPTAVPTAWPVAPSVAPTPHPTAAPSSAVPCGTMCTTEQCCAARAPCCRTKEVNGATCWAELAGDCSKSEAKCDGCDGKWVRRSSV